MQACPPRGHGSVLEERRQAARVEVQARSAARAARASAGSVCRTTACSCARSRSCAACTACSNGSSATTTRRRRGSKARPARTCCEMLESRLDNVVYRMGFACDARRGAPAREPRGITVNEQIVNIPSYQLKAGDKIAVRERAKEQLRIKAALDHRRAGRVSGVGRSGRQEHAGHFEERAGARRDPAGYQRESGGRAVLQVTRAVMISMQAISYGVLAA